MKRVFVIGLLLSASVALGQSIPELFGKAKEEIKAGSWADASKTLDALEAEAGKPGNEGVRKQLDAPLAFYRGVCSANLGKVGRGRRQLRRFPQAAAQRLDRQGGLLEESRGRLREGAESGGGPHALARRSLRRVFTAGRRRRDRGPVLGRRARAVDHDGRREGGLDRARGPQRARHFRRDLLDGARRGPRSRRADLPPGVRASRRVRRRQPRAGSREARQPDRPRHGLRPPRRAELGGAKAHAQRRRAGHLRRPLHGRIPRRRQCSARRARRPDDLRQAR